MNKRCKLLNGVCMKKLLYVITVFLVFGSSALALPMSGSISADYDLSFESIIKKKFGSIFEASKIFEKNDDIFYQRRFKPLYMLSLHELYNKKPLLKNNLDKRKIPNSYSLSLSGSTHFSESNIILSEQDGSLNINELSFVEKSGDFEKINAEYEATVAKNPDRIELLYKYAQFLYLNKKYLDSISVLTDITKKDDGFLLAFYTLGNIYFDMGDYKRAIKANLEVVKKNPYCADAYFNIASALEKMHKFNLAIDYYQKCLSLNANDEQAQNALQRLEQLTYLTD